MVTIREVKDRWAIEVDGMDLPLQKDLRLRVNGAAVTYKVKPEQLAGVYPVPAGGLGVPGYGFTAGFA